MRQYAYCISLETLISNVKHIYRNAVKLILFNFSTTVVMLSANYYKYYYLIIKLITRNDSITMVLVMILFMFSNKDNVLTEYF